MQCVRKTCKKKLCLNLTFCINTKEVEEKEKEEEKEEEEEEENSFNRSQWKTVANQSSNWIEDVRERDR